jgi:hypothetical protein
LKRFGKLSFTGMFGILREQIGWSLRCFVAEEVGRGLSHVSKNSIGSARHGRGGDMVATDEQRSRGGSVLTGVG